MHLVVFGAAGRTGAHVVGQALEQGHTVTAFVRSPARLTAAGLPASHERLRVWQGDVYDPGRVEEAIAGQDAVVCTIGHTKTSGEDVLTATVQHALAAMRRHGVRRLVSLVRASVADPRDPASVGRSMRRALMHLAAPGRLADAERHAELLRASGLDWTLVRPARLVDGPRRGAYRTGYLVMGPRATISRPDLADFLVRLAVDGGYVHEAPMVCY